MREVMFFQELGYAVLFVNFRGSIGAGQDSVDSLLGHVGDTDVKDCRQALDECLEVKNLLGFSSASYNLRGLIVNGMWCIITWIQVASGK
jgi:alpha/beta superfamily hydrolase